MDCYWSDTIPNKNDRSGPCSSGSGVHWCCNVGDYCLSNGLCHYGDDNIGTGASGYYLSGCTDQSFKSGVCRSNCTDYATTDIVYDWGARQWRCCGTSNGQRACMSGPQGSTMSAPAPPDYTTYATIIGSGTFLPMTGGASVVTGGVTTTINGLPVASAQPTSVASTSMSTGSSGLGPGAAAGVAIGAMVGSIMIAGLIGFLFWRRRHRKHQLQPPPQADSPGGQGGATGVVDFHAAEKASRRHELRTTHSTHRSELPTEGASSPPHAHEVGIHT